jgi:hypothetical protein
MATDIFEQGYLKSFVFDAVYTHRAAEEQAEKKKLTAFPLLDRINPFAARPKVDDVLQAKATLRHEPFWYLSTCRAVDYICEIDYPITVNNEHAKSVSLKDHSFEITHGSGKPRIVIPVQEKCYRKIPYHTYLDGLKREIKQSTMEQYVKKYKMTEVESIDPSLNAIALQVPLTSIKQIAVAKLQGEAIKAHEILMDELVFEKCYVYYRPVFAFEFLWTTTGKTGVIEVDGLTGEVMENGVWYQDTIDRVMTREMLVMVGAEIANHIIPGGGLALHMADRLVSKSTK